MICVVWYRAVQEYQAPSVAGTRWLFRAIRRKMRLQELYSTIILSVVLVCAHSNVAAQTENAVPNSDLPQTYAATAFGQSGSLAGKNFGVTVYVTAWTSDQEVHNFAATLKSGGPNGLVSALGKSKEVGRLSPTGFVGSGFRIARLRPAAGGETKIIMVTDRPIAFGEAYNSTRSRDYQFGIVALNLDKDGNGTGTLAPVCKIKFNKKDELEIENYGQKPLRLANVRRMK
jgi:hypothetical protein